MANGMAMKGYKNNRFGEAHNTNIINLLEPSLTSYIEQVSSIYPIPLPI